MTYEVNYRGFVATDGELFVDPKNISHITDVTSVTTTASTCFT